MLLHASRSLHFPLVMYNSLSSIGKPLKCFHHLVFEKNNPKCVNNSHSQMTSLNKRTFLIGYCNLWDWLPEIWGHVVWYLNICFMGSCDSIFFKKQWFLEVSFLQPIIAPLRFVSKLVCGIFSLHQVKHEMLSFRELQGFGVKVIIEFM